MRAATMTLLLALAMLGCARVHPFETGGYQHPQFPIYVAAGEAERLVSQDWLVDGWTLNVNEQPTRRFRSYGRQTDLALRHRTNSGRMWLDVVPVEAHVRDQELRVVGQEVVAVGNAQHNNLGAAANELRMLGNRRDRSVG
ncbi:MAG: hypothetical protein IPL19_00005, partial [Sandaracinaceae bacterium]|nr:hypothetical protein [Sandaracinaceae bacterium]